jgi:membrane-associated phospholipid phosphatase
VKGGGISAFPSMHLGAASIYVLAARKTPWFLPSLLFWAAIFLSSGYFGYHYWIDGIAAAGVAILCWFSAEKALSSRWSMRRLAGTSKANALC